MNWDPVQATRNLGPIPGRFASEFGRMDELFEAFKPQAQCELRHVYSLQSVPEILRDGSGRTLVWDWRWVEHVRRVMCWALTDVDGLSLGGALSYLALSERALEERDEDLARACLWSVRRTGDLTLQEFDRILEEADDHAAACYLANMVEDAAFLHEVAHLLLEEEDSDLVNTREMVLTTIAEIPEVWPELEDEWNRMRTNEGGDEYPTFLDYLTEGDITEEIVCDFYAFHIFRNFLAAALRQGSRQVQSVAVSMWMYFVVIDFFEMMHRTFSERRYLLETDFRRNKVERWIRHRLVVFLYTRYFIKDTTSGLWGWIRRGRLESALMEEVDAAHRIAHTARYYLLVTVEKVSHGRFRDTWRSLGRSPEVASACPGDVWETLAAKVGWEA